MTSPPVNAYGDLPTLKGRLGIGDTRSDDLLTSLLEAGSRAIDNEVGRRFYPDPAPVQRYYQARTDAGYLALLANPFLERKSWSRYPLDVGDLLVCSLVETNDSGDRTSWVSWSPTVDYYLEPINATADLVPFNRIRPDPLSGRYWFPPWPQGIRVTGTWGYAFDYDNTGVRVAPFAIREALYLLTTRLFKRKDAPFGVVEAGAVEKLATRLKADADIVALIDPFRYSTNQAGTGWVLA